MDIKLINYEVSHPVYGTVVVASIGPDSATLAAFDSWGARSEWGREVANCDVKKLGPARKPRCRVCGGEYGKAGEPVDGLCPFCARTAVMLEKERDVRRRGTDRRTGYRERHRDRA